MTPAVAAEVERCLRTGPSDMHRRARSSDSFMERCRLAHEDLRGALVAEVLRRSQRVKVPPLPTL